VVKRYALT